MKLTFTVIILFPFVLFCQFKTEWVDRKDLPQLVYPISEIYGSQVDEGAEVPVIQQSDGSFMAYPEFRKSFRRERKFYHRYSFLDYRSFRENIETISLSLDSLSDGRYVQYYDNVPILRNDTIFLADTCIAAIFTIKNGLLHGDAEKFYPNGLLKQKCHYEFGELEGNCFFQGVNFRDIYMHNGPDLTFSMWIEQWYRKGLKDGSGRLTRIYGYYFREKGPEDSWKYIYSYKNDSLNGHFEVYYNDTLFTRGDFSMGSQTGSWLFNQMYEHKIVPLRIMTYNQTKTSLFYHLPAIHDFELPDPKNQGRFGYGHGSTGIEVQDVDPPRDVDHFSDLFFISDMTGLTLDDYMGDYNYATDSLGNPYSYNELVATRGAFAIYSGIYEEHYDNGKLKWKIDLSSPSTLADFTVYWENGKPKSVVKPFGNNGFEQLWYDSLGILKMHIQADSSGKTIATPVDPNHLVIDGNKYYGNGIYWRLEKKQEPIRIDEPRFFLIDETRSYSDLSLLELHMYNPADRKGKVKRFYKESFVKSEYEYAFSRNYDTVTNTEVVQLGSLERKSKISTRLDTNVWFRQLKISPSDTVFERNLLNRTSVNTHFTERQLTQYNELFTGILTIYSDTTLSEIKIREKKGKVTIYVNPYNWQQKKMVISLLPVNTNLFDNTLSRDHQYSKPVKKIFPFTVKKIVFTFRNGKLNGPAEYKAQNGQVLFRGNFKNNEIHGKQVTWNEYPNTLAGFGGRSYSSHYSEQQLNALKKGYVSTIATFENGKMNGAFVKFNYEGDSLISGFYRNDKQFGDPYSFGRYANSNEGIYTFYDGMTEIRAVTMELSTRRVIKKEDFITGRSESYHENGELAQELQILRDKDSAVLICRDTFGQITDKLLFKNSYLIRHGIYHEGTLHAVVENREADSVVFVFSYMNSESTDLYNNYFYAHRKSTSSFEQPTGLMTIFNDSGIIVVQGRLEKGAKVGTWNRFAGNILVTTIRYFNRKIQQKKGEGSIAEITFYDPDGKIRSSGIVTELETEFSCSDKNHLEQYQVEFSVNDYKPAIDTVPLHRNYFPNGVIMNEGRLVNGKPDGLWRWYHSDGSLRKLGKYQDGNKTGRWLEGDLSKVNFMGEMCLDPESVEFSELLKTIDFQVEYYENGKLMHSEEHQFKLSGK